MNTYYHVTRAILFNPELEMLRFSLGVTRMDKIRNEYIRGPVGRFGENTWSFGHVRRKFDGYIGRRMLRMERPGKRKRGRPKRRLMDALSERTWQWLKLQRRLQKIETNGDGKSAAATIDGKSRRKKKFNPRKKWNTHHTVDLDDQVLASDPVLCLQLAMNGRVISQVQIFLLVQVLITGKPNFEVKMIRSRAW